MVGHVMKSVVGITCECFRVFDELYRLDGRRSEANPSKGSRLSQKPNSLGDSSLLGSSQNNQNLRFSPGNTGSQRRSHRVYACVRVESWNLLKRSPQVNQNSPLLSRFSLHLERALPS